MLVAGIVVDVDRDAAEGGDFGGELGEAVVVLSGFGEPRVFRMLEWVRREGDCWGVGRVVDGWC